MHRGLEARAHILSLKVKDDKIRDLVGAQAISLGVEEEAAGRWPGLSGLRMPCLKARPSHKAHRGELLGASKNRSEVSRTMSREAAAEALERAGEPGLRSAAVRSG